jgi:hypothetical protein
MENPMTREMRIALRQYGAALCWFQDLLMHVAEARRRFETSHALGATGS